MGRTPFLTTLAWGRSIWTTPEENEWDRDAQKSCARALEASSPEPDSSNTSQQRYDDNLRPINPVAQLDARDRRRAANNILTIIGVVEQTRGSRVLQSVEQRQLEELWCQYYPHAANFWIIIPYRWVVNLFARLQASSWRPEQSLTERIIEDYRLLGTTQFFFASLTAIIPEMLSVPSTWTEEYCYWTLRAVCANISSIEIREAVINAKPWIEQSYDVLLELANFPITLHRQLQQLGLIRSFSMFPSAQLLIAIFDSIRHPSSASLSLLGMFLHGLLIKYLTSEYIYPTVGKVLGKYYAARGYENGIGAGFEDAVGSDDQEEPGAQRQFASAAANHGGPREPERATNVDNVAPVTTQRAESSLIAVHRTAALQFDEEIDAGARTTLAPPATDLTGVANHNTVSMDEATTVLEVGPQQEDNLHQIRIAGRQDVNGTVVEELNIHFHDSAAMTSSDNQVTLQTRASAEKRKVRHLFPMAIITDAYVSVHLLVTAGQLLCTPLDCWMMSTLANWWLSTCGKSDHVGQQLLGRNPAVAISAFAMTPSTLLWSCWKWGQKYFLCSAMRTLVIVSECALQNEAIIWLGRRKFGWPKPGLP